MPVAEGPALDVLAGHPDADAVGQDRRHRELFGRRPLDRPRVGLREHLRALLARPFELLVDRKTGRRGEERRIERGQPLERDCRVRLRGGPGRWRFRLRLDEVFLRLQLVQRPLQLVHVFLAQGLRLGRLDEAALDQRTSPDLAHRRVRRDLLVHHRLRERRLVPLVVPPPSIADQVDEEVALEPGAIREGQPRRLDARFGIVGVDVDDRDLESAREAARIRGAVRLTNAGGEPELVVDDDVDRPARVPAVQAAQVQRFRDDALSGKRRVAVNQDRHAPRRIELRRTPLVRRRPRGPRHAFHDRIDRLEMARVGRHRHLEVHRAPILNRALGPGVVLHIPGPRHVLAEVARRHRILELGQDLLVRLAQHVRHHVEAAAVRHPDEDRTDPGFPGLADHFVEDRHEDVEPFDREARLAGERPVQETLERLDLRQPVEQRDRVDRIGGLAEPSVLGGLAEPLALCRHEHLRVIVARRGAVDAAERRHQLLHVRRLVVQWRRDQIRRNTPQVVFGQAMCFRLERRIAWRLRPERIELRGKMAIPPDRLGQVDGRDRRSR